MPRVTSHNARVARSRKRRASPRGVIQATHAAPRPVPPPRAAHRPRRYGRHRHGGVSESARAQAALAEQKHTFAVPSPKVFGEVVRFIVVAIGAISRGRSAPLDAS